MEINLNKSPRKFKVGMNSKISIKDFGKIHLKENEQITFITENKGEYDVARKSWGFYATPSINGRLKSFGFRTALVKNKKNQFFIMIVEKCFEEDFFKYLKEESNELITWLSEEDSVFITKN